MWRSLRRERVAVGEGADERGSLADLADDALTTLRGLPACRIRSTIRSRLVQRHIVALHSH
jgi:hypothetical protein